MRNLKFFFMTLVLACTFSIPVFADDITADILTYDGNSKIATAEGNVVIHANQGAVITGQKGQYYFGDRSAWLEGNVRYEKDEMVMTADKLYIYNDKTVHGTGSVYLNDRSEGRVLKGDDVTYNADTGIGKIRGGGYLEFSDASMQAPLIEGNLKQVEIVASGGVNLTSDSRQMTGYSDVATYTRSGINGNDGKLVLTGNAHIVQNGNSFDGPELVIWDADKIIETTGRSTLVITNTSSGSK